MSLYMTDEKGQLHKIAGGGGGGSSIKIDDVLDNESKNPVQNKTLYNPVVFAENERQKSKNLWSYGDVSGTLNKTIILDAPLPADTYTISAFCEGSDTDSSQCLVIFYGESGATIKNSYYYKNQRNAKTIVAQEPITKITFYASSNYANSKNDTFSFTDIQIELGSTETGYTKHYGAIVHSNEVYPVGSIYMSVNNISPASFFGGVWEKIEDRFLLASGSNYSLGITGGSADAVVVSHRHQFTVRQNVAIGSYTSIPSMTVNSTNTTAQGNTTTVGEDGVGKNMPPYLVVNVWKRVAEEEYEDL